MFALPNLLDESLNGTETLSEDEVQTRKYHKGRTSYMSASKTVSISEV